MNEKHLNDFFVEIWQNYLEVESSLKILKNAIQNENSDFSISDIANNLEIIITLLSNTTISLDKFINELD